MKKRNLLGTEKGFLVRDWVSAFIVFVAISSLCFAAIYGIGNKYDKQDVIDSDFNSTYNKMSEMKQNTEDIRTAVVNKSGLSLVTGVGTTFIKGTSTVVQIVVDSLTLPGRMMKKVADLSGAPDIVGDIFFALPLLLMTIIVIFLVISALNRTRM